MGLQSIDLVRGSATMSATAVLLAVAGVGGPAGAPAAAYGRGTDRDTILRVVSFNVRYDEPADGPHAWGARRERVFALLAEKAPDVAGLQEALAHQVRELAEALPDHAWTGVGRDDGREAGEFSPIFYRRNRLELRESGTFWLAPDPARPGSLGWDAAYPRIATWARFLDRETGGCLLVLNAHLDHQGPRAREEGARLLRERGHELAAGLPIVLTGDLNAEPDDPPLRVLASRDGPGPPLVDLRAAAARAGGPAGTFAGFRAGPPPTRRIDYVLAVPGTTVLRHVHLADVVDGAYPSDHLPVLVDLVLPAGEGPCPSGS